MAVQYVSRIRLSIRVYFCRPARPLHYQKPIFLRTLKMAATTEVQSKFKRPICESCSKPDRTCLCSRFLFPGLDNSVSITILQHSLEKNHHLNSTRIVKLGLRNVHVAMVSDVVFDAKFGIWLNDGNFELGSDRNCDKGMDENDGFDVHGCLDLRRENVGQHDVIEVSENCSLNWNVNCSGTACDDFKKTQRRVRRVNYVSRIDEEPVISIAMEKRGVIRLIEHAWMSSISSQKVNIDDVFKCQMLCEALAKGFLVRKLQKRQHGHGVVLEEFEEFELEVPPGSVLLFPSEEALSVDELNALDIEIRNLIVLDGTWMKAKRMYSENPWLRFLPHLKLDPHTMSLYGEVRSQPKAGCLSTVESIIYALKAVGCNPEGLENLLDVFESMVNDQRKCKDEKMSKRSFNGVTE